MLSQIEREYVQDPLNFEKTHSDSHIRKIRNNIRKKICIAVEDFAVIIKFTQTKYDHDVSSKGRNRKSIMPLGADFVLYDSLHWSESLEPQKAKWEDSLKGNIALTQYSTFKDTKIGKWLYKKEKKQ